MLLLLRQTVITTCALILLASCTNTQSPSEKTSWKTILDHDLHLLGHRNWILVVDKAFPEQSAGGMKYLYAEEDLLPTLEYVLEKIENSGHVRPVIYRDRELEFLTEEQVPGIDSFRAGAEKVLGGKEVQTLLHYEVFAMLEESSSLFRVLVIKTNCRLPYTSVFLELDCSYWGPEDVQVLREKMR